MKHLIMAIAAIVVVTQTAHAAVTNETITQTNTVIGGLTFRVTVREHANISFFVVVSATDPSALSSIGGTLILKDATGMIGQFPIVSWMEGSTRKFLFEINRKLIASSELSISSLKDVEPKDTRGGGILTEGVIYHVLLSELVR